MLPQIKTASGSVLTVVLIGLGVITALIMVTNQRFRDQMAFQKLSTLEGDKEVFRQMLINRTSCNLTLPSGSCNVSGFVEVRGRLSSGGTETLINNQNPVTRFGNWALRAECDTGANTLLVRATRLTPAGNINSTNSEHFRRGPLSRLAVTWADDASYIFPPTNPLCPKTSERGFPRPDYDSGWVFFGSNDEIEIDHRLNTRQYVAMHETKIGSQIQERFYTTSGNVGNYIRYFADERVVLDEQGNRRLKVKKWLTSVYGDVEPYNDPQHPATSVRVRIWKLR